MTNPDTLTSNQNAQSNNQSDEQSNNQSPTQLSNQSFNQSFNQPTNVKREVICSDTIDWLNGVDEIDGCVVVSPPDVCELIIDGQGVPMEEWREFYINVLDRIIRKTAHDAVVIVYCTSKRNPDSTEWIDKSHLVMLAADRASARVIWHKIVVPENEMMVKGGKATYSHMICVAGSRVTDHPRHVENCHLATPDLIQKGLMLWPRAMGLRACEFAVNYVINHTNHRLIVDPFAGQGGILAVANRYGLDALGVELSPKRCQQARDLQLVDDSTLDAGMSKRAIRRRNKQVKSVQDGEVTNPT